MSQLSTVKFLLNSRRLVFSVFRKQFTFPAYPALPESVSIKAKDNQSQHLVLIAIQCVAVLLHRSAFTCQMEQKILLIFFSFMMETRFEKQQHVNCSSPNVLSEYVFLSFIHQIQDTNYKNIRRRKDENTIGGKDRNTNTNAIKNPDS